MDLPLFGRKRRLLETINSIDSKWHVELWEEHFYFLRMEIFSRKKERIVRNKENRNKQK
jgi:hypothetical protein